MGGVPLDYHEDLFFFGGGGGSHGGVTDSFFWRGKIVMHGT